MLIPQEHLRKNNPFISHSVTQTEIWNPHYPDIESIHQDAFHVIMQFVQKKQKNPTMAVAILVLGEGGTGKTQLLVRIVRHCLKETGWAVSLTNLTPIHDAQPMKHLLQNIFTGLYDEFTTRPNSPLFQRIISGILFDSLLSKGFQREKIHDGLRHFFAYHGMKHGDVDTLSERVIDWTRQQDITLDQEFLQVLFQVCNKSRRNAAIRWLKGDTLDRDAAELLGLSFDPDTDETREISESKAQMYLITFGKLLARYNLTLLICVDQLEMWEGSEKHHKLGTIMQTILGQCPGMVPITFARTGLWNEVIAKDLDPSLLALLSMNSVTLHGCTKKQVQDLIKVRIKHCFGKDWEEPYQWLIQKIRDDESISFQPTPRDVILAANKIICGEISCPEIILHAKYNHLCAEALQTIDSSLPTSDELVRALGLYFSGIGIDFKRKKEYIETSAGWFLVVNTKDTHQTIGRCFNDGSKYLARNPRNVCVYITDPRCEIIQSTWKETNRKKEEFEAKNGIICQPNNDEISRFYALSELEAEITQGNIRDENDREITREDFHQFIKNPEQFEPLIDVGKLHQERLIQNVLLSAPEQSLPITEVLEKIAEMGFYFTPSLLQDICESKPDVYGINDTYIRIHGYWRGIADAICDIITKTGYNFIATPDIIKKLHDKKSLIYPLSEEELMQACQIGDLKDLFSVDKIRDGYMIRRK